MSIYNHIVSQILEGSCPFCRKRIAEIDASKQSCIGCGYLLNDWTVYTVSRNGKTGTITCDAEGLVQRRSACFQEFTNCGFAFVSEDKLFLVVRKRDKPDEGEATFKLHSKDSTPAGIPSQNKG